MGGGRADDAVRRIGIKRVGACDGLLEVGPAVAVRVGLRVEGFGEKIAVVVGLFPEVAEGVFVGVEDGGKRGRSQNSKTRDQKEEPGAGRSGDGLEQDAPATLKTGSHLAAPFAGAGFSVRQ